MMEIELFMGVEGKWGFWLITTHFGPLFKLALNLTEKMKKINKK